MKNYKDECFNLLCKISKDKHNKDCRVFADHFRALLGRFYRTHEEYKELNSIRSGDCVTNNTIVDLDYIVPATAEPKKELKDKVLEVVEDSKKMKDVETLTRELDQAFDEFASELKASEPIASPAPKKKVEKENVAVDDLPFEASDVTLQELEELFELSDEELINTLGSLKGVKLYANNRLGLDIGKHERKAKTLKQFREQIEVLKDELS